MACSFEQVAEELQKLPRMFLEPDGSFVWVGQENRWQIDGNLFDRDGKLVYVELKGKAGSEALRQIAECLGWPRQALVVQLVREARFVAMNEFLGMGGSDSNDE